MGEVALNRRLPSAVTSILCVDETRARPACRVDLHAARRDRDRYAACHRLARDTRDARDRRRRPIRLLVCRVRFLLALYELVDKGVGWVGPFGGRGEQR